MKKLILLLFIPLVSFGQSNPNNEKDSSIATNMIGEGMTLYESGEYYEAISKFIQGIELFPPNDDFYYNTIMIAYDYIGKSKMGLKDYNGAISEFTKIIESNAEFFSVSKDDVYLQRANAKFMLDDYYGTIYDLTTAIEKYYSISENPSKYDLEQYSKGYSLRGLAKSKIGDHINAIIDYTISINLNAENGEAYLYRFFAYSFLKSKTEACKDLNNVIELGYRPKVHKDGGIGMLSEEEFEKLVRYCDEQ